MISNNNILIITYNDYPVYEGLGIRIKNLSKILAENEYVVTILAPNIDNRQPKKEMIGRVQIIRFNIFVPKFIIKNRVIARCWSMIIQTIFSPLLYLIHFRKSNVKFIFSEHIYSIPCTLIFKLFSKAKIVVDDIIDVSTILKESGHHKTERVFKVFEKLMFKFCDEFIYTSEISKNYYQQRGAIPNIYVPNGVNCDEFKSIENNNEYPIVFFNGSTYSGQNVEAINNFIKIGNDIHKKNTNIKFNLCCWPAYNLNKETLEKIRNSSQWLFFQEGAEKIEDEINKADITILPYSKGHGLTGGTRLKSLEYMSCGKLLISTDEGIQGIKGLIADEHFILAENIEDFERLILMYAETPEINKAIGDHARDFVLENYDWRATTKPLIDFLKNS